MRSNALNNLRRWFTMAAACAMLGVAASPASAVIIFSDAFTQTADTTLASHTPTTAGLSWTTVIQNGGATLRADASSDNCQQNSGGANDGVLYQANVTGGYQNVDYEASVVQVNGDTIDDYNWIAVRVQDANNLYVFRFNESDGQLFERVGGAYATLGAATAGITDGSTVTLRVIGTTLTVLDDGVTIRTLTDASHTAAGTAGLGMGDISETSTDDLDAQTLDTFSVNTYVRITGTVYSDEGTTAVGAGVNVSVSVNGAAPALTDATDASGVYDLRGLTAAVGDVLTIYVNDNTAGNEAAVVTVTNTNDLSVDLYYNYLKVRHDNAGSLTSANLNTADNSGDSDITGLYTMPGGVLTMAAGKELFIETGHTYAPGANIDVITIDINGTLTMAGNIANVSGDWDATGGSFSFTTGDVIFDGGATTQNVTSNASSFNDVQIGTGAVGAVVATADAMDINGALTVLNGGATTFNISDDTVSAASTVTLTNLDTFTVTNSTFVFDGTTTLTSASRAFNNVQIGSASAGGSLTTADNMDINGNLTVQNGGATTFNVTGDTINAAADVTLTNLDTFTVTNSTFIFDGTTTLTSAALPFNNVQLGTGAVGGSLTTADNMEINGTSTILNGGATTWNISDDTVTVANNLDLTNLDTFTVTNSTFVFDGTTTLTSDTLSFNNVQIGTASLGATLTTADAMDINGALSVLNGGATTFNISDDTVSAASTVNLTNLDTFTVTNSTFVFDGTTTLTNAARAFNNVQIGSASAGGSVTTADNMDINGALTVQNGGATTFDVSNDTVSAASTVNLTNLDTFTVASATFIFDGTTTLTSAGLAFNAVQIGTGAVGGSVTTADNMDINGALTVLNGGATTFNISDDTVSAASTVTLTNLDTFTVTNSTFIFDGTTTLTSAGLAFNAVQIGTGAVGGSLTTADNMDINGALTVLNGGATTFDISNDTVNAASNVTLTNLDTFTVASATFIFDGTTTLTSAGLAFNAVQIGTGAVGASVTTADNMNIDGAFTVLNGGATTFNISDDTINAASTVTLTNLDTFTVTNSTFIFDGTTTLTSAGLAFNAVQIGTGAAGGSLTTADNMDINGALTVLNGGATTFDISNDTVNAASTVNLTNLDTFTVASSTFIFDGTTTLTSAGRAFNAVQIGTGAVGGSVTTADNMDINGALTVLNGGATTFDVTGDTINAASTVTLTNLDTFTVTNSTFIFDGTTTLTSAGLAFNAVQIGSATAGGSLTTADNMDVNGALTVNNGGATTFDVTADTISVAGDVTFTNLDTFTVTNSTFIFDGTTTLTSAALPFNNVQIGTGAVGGSLTTADNMEINGTSTILNGGATTWVVSDDTITVANNLDLTNLDTFTVANSTFVFDGTTSLTSDTLAFNNIQIGTGALGATLTALDNMDVNGNVTVLNGGATTWTITNRSVNAAGNVTLTNLDTFNNGNTTFAFDGTTNLTSAGYTFVNIQIGTGTSAGSLTTVDNLDIDGILAVNNGGATTWNITNDVITMSGAALSLTNLDTFTTVDSTIIFDGATAVTSAGNSFESVQIGTTGAGASVTAGDDMSISGTLIVRNGGATTLDISNLTLTMGGTMNLTNLDTFTVTNATVAFNGTTPLTSAGLAFNHVQIGTAGAGATVTTNDNLDVNGNLTVQNGGATTLNITNDVIAMSGATLNLTNLDTFTTVDSTFVFDGTSTVTSDTKSFESVQIGTAAAGGSVTTADNMTISGTVVVLNGGATTFNIDSDTVTVGGTVNLTNLDTFTVTNSTFAFNGTTPLTTAGLTFNHVQIGTAGAGASVTTNDNWDINGNVTVQNGGATTLDITGDTVNAAGNVTLTNLDTFTVTNATVIFDGTTTLTSASLPFHHVQIGTGAVGASLTTADNMEINGNISILNGGATTWDVSADTITAATDLDLTNLDTFTVVNSTFVFDGTTALTSAGKAFNNIQIGSAAAGGSLTTADNLDLNGALTVTNNGATTFNVTNDVVSAASTVNLTNLDTFTTVDSTFIFDGASTVTSDTKSFESIQIGTAAAGGSVTTADNMTISGTVIVRNGGATTFNIDSDTVTVGGTVNLTNLDTFTVTNSTFAFNGTTPLTSAGLAFNHFQIGTAGAGATVTANDNLDINGNVTFQNGGATTFVITDRVITAAGDVTFTNIDTFTNTDSTIVFDGTTTLTSAGQNLIGVQLGSASAGGSLTTADNMSIDGTFRALNGGATTFDVTGDTVTFSGPSFSMANLDTFTSASSTFNFDTSSGTVPITSNAKTFNNVTFNDGGGGTTWFIVDAMDINGTYTLTSGSFDLATNDPTINVANNFTIASAGTFTVGTNTVTFDGNLTFNDVDQTTLMGSLVIDPTTTLGSDLSCTNLTINASDTLVTAGYEITCSGNITINGTLNAAPGADGNTTITLGRTWDNNNLFISTSSTVIFNGTGNRSISSDGDAFNNLSINGGGTWDLIDNLDVNGTLRLITGTLDVTTNNRQINLARDWVNSGGNFTQRSGTVVLDGAVQQNITAGTQNFANISVTSTSVKNFVDDWSVVNFTDNTANSDLIFDAGSTYTITGSLRLNGQAAGTRIDLNSNDNLTRFTFDVTGSSQTVSFVNVSNSQASSNDINTVNSSRGTNTDAFEASPHWVFDAAAFVYYWTGTSDATTWEDQGNWDVLDGTPGDDGYPDDDSDAVIIDATAHSIVTNGATTIGNLRMEGAFTGSLTLDPGTTFTIEGTGLYLSDGTLVTGGTLDVNGTLNLAGGTIDMTATDGNFNISGSLRIEPAGVFTAGMGTTTFDGDLTYIDVDGLTNMGTLVIDPTTNMGSDLTCVNLTILAGDTLVTNGYEITCSRNITINGTLNAAPGADGNTTINIGRTWTNNNLFIGTSTTVIFDGGGARDITSGGDAFNNLRINGTATWTLQDPLDVNGFLDLTAGTLDVSTNDFQVNVGGNWTDTGGTFVERSGTVIFDGTSTVTSAGESFFNLQIGTASTGGSVTTADSLSIDGTLRMLNGGATTFNITNDTVTMTGGILDLTNLDTFTTVDSTIIFDGTTTITNAGKSFESIQVGTAALGASVTTVDDMTLTGSLKVTNGGATTFDITSNVLTTAGTMDFTNLDTFTVTNSTVVFNGTTLLTTGNKDFNHIVIGGTASGGSLITASNLRILGTVTVTNNGATTWNISDDTIVAFADVNLTNLDTFTVTNATVAFPGTTNLTSFGHAFNHVLIGNDSAGGSLTLLDNMDINGNFSVTNFAATSFIITSRTVNAAGNFTMTNLDTFTTVDSTVIFDGTTTLTNAGLSFESVQLGTAIAGASVTTADNMTYTGTLLVRNGGATTFNISNDVVTTAGTMDFTNLDTFTTVDSTVIFNGTSPVTSGTVSFESIQIGTAAAGASVTTIGNMVVTGTIQVLNGGVTSLDITNDTVTVGGTLSWANLDTFTVIDSTVIFNGTTSLTSGGKVFESVQLGTATAGATVTTQDNMTLTGTLKVLNGGVTTLDIANDSLTTAGTLNFTNLDTFTSTNSTVIFNGTNPLTSAGLAFNNFQIGTASAGATVTNSGTLDINGNITVQNGGATTFDVTLAIVNVAGDVNFTNLDTFTSNLSVFIFDGTTTLTSAGKTFNSVQMGIGGGNSSLTTADNMDVSGSFLTTGGGVKSLDISNDTVSVGFDMNLLGLDTFLTTDSTLIFDGATSFTSNGFTVESIQIGSATGGGSLTTVGNLTYTGTLLVRNGGATTFDITNDVITTAGTVDLTNLDTFTTVDSTVIFNGTSPVTSGTVAFESVQIGTASAGATVTTIGNMVVTGTLQVLNGGATTFDITNDTVTVGGTLSWANLDTFTVIDSTVIFNGTTPLTSGGKIFESVQLGTATAGATVTTQDNMTLTGTLKVLNGGATSFDITNDIVTTAGTVDFTNLDTFTVIDSTVIFNGTTALTSAGRSFMSVQLGTTVAGGVVTTSDALSIDGTLRVLNGGATSLDITGDTLTFSGLIFDLTNLDTFTSATSSAVFDTSSGTVFVTSFGKAFHNIQFNDAGGGTSWQIVDAMDANGTFTLTSGTFDLATNDPTINVADDFTIASAGTFTVGINTVTFDGNLTFIDVDETTVMGSLVIDPTTTLGSDLTCTNLTINASDTLVTNGYEVTCSGNITINGTLNAAPGVDGNSTITLGRTWTNNNLFIGTSSTVIFNGTGNRSITSGGDSFNNLRINGGGTWDLLDNLDVDGTLRLITGTLDVTTSNRQINVARDWVNTGGTFTQRSGTVIFDGVVEQDVTAGTQNFSRLEVTNTGTVNFIDDWSAVHLKDVTPNSTLIFDAGSTYTISGTLTLNGQAEGTRIILNSNDNLTRFAFSVSTLHDVSYLDVRNSEISGTDNVRASFSLNTNTDKDEPAPHWIFVGDGPKRGAVMVVD